MATPFTCSCCPTLGWRCIRHSLIGFRTATPLLGMLAIAFGVGCGGGPSAPPARPASGDVSDGNGPVKPADARPETVVKVDPARKETKWIGTIPYDVFYDRPLEIAADGTRLDGGTPALATATDPASASTALPDTPAPESEPAPKPSIVGPDWKAVIPMPVLEEEVKVLRTRLGANLNTLATYNKNIPAIANDGNILAAMAAVAVVHPDAVNWKEKAPFVRDLAYNIFISADGTGRTPYTATKEPFDRIITMLDGGPPPDMEAEPLVPFADVIYIPEMMKRIDSSVTALKANINTEQRMKEDPNSVIRELRVLATFAAIMGTEGYEFAGEQKYQDFVKAFRDAGLEGADAVAAGNFIAFQEALNKLQSSCGTCHQQYRNKESAF